MFFDKVLVENSELRRVWRAGFGRIEDPEKSTSFPEICANLEECVGSEDPDPRRRLSLRTSSVLVEGAARIYRQELNTLMEDLSEVDRVMANRRRRKLTDAEGETSTDSSNPSTPYDTPENMRPTSRHSDVTIQRPENETIQSLTAPDLSHPLSAISKSTNGQSSSQNDVENGQSAKRRKMTDQSNSSSGYPSSPDLTTDRNSAGSSSDEIPVLADDIQDILQISEQATRKANSEFHFDDQARKSDQNETEKSSEEETPCESPSSPTFTEEFNVIAALPTFEPDTEIPEIDEERTQSMADKNSEEIINEADTRKFVGNVTIGKKVEKSRIRRSDRNDVVRDSVNGQVSHISNTRRRRKNINGSVVKKDQATQMDDIPFHPNTSERDGRVNVNLPFGYLLIHNTYGSRYPSKIVLSSLNPVWNM